MVGCAVSTKTRVPSMVITQNTNATIKQKQKDTSRTPMPVEKRVVFNSSPEALSTGIPGLVRPFPHVWPSLARSPWSLPWTRYTWIASVRLGSLTRVGDPQRTPRWKKRKVSYAEGFYDDVQNTDTIAETIKSRSGLNSSTDTTRIPQLSK